MQRIRLKHATASEWTSSNPTLLSGEPGVETDTGKIKIGDGSTAWTSLNYSGFSSEVKSISFNNVSDPSSPSTGDLALYSSSTGGRSLLKYKNEFGEVNWAQPALFGNMFIRYFPGTSGTPNVLGGPSLTHVGTVTHPTPTETSYRESLTRWISTGSASANSAAESRMAVLRVWRGDRPGWGGFFLSLTFAISSSVSTQQVFAGLYGATGALAGTTVPSALVNTLGIGWDNGDSNVHFINNTNTGSSTKTDLGSNFPTNTTTAVYNLTLFCKPNGDSVSYTVTRLETGHTVSGSVNSNLPLSTTFMSPRVHCNNGGTASSVVMECMGIYLEADN